MLSLASLYEGECQEMEQQSEPVSPGSDSERADIRGYLCDQPQGRWHYLAPIALFTA